MIRNDPTKGAGGLKKEVDGVCEKRLNNILMQSCGLFAAILLQSETLLLLNLWNTLLACVASVSV